ncbi:MAG: agmatinase [Pseudomonadota bacterium]
MSDATFQPISGTNLPRFAGPATFLRLPHVPPDDPLRAAVDIGLLGMPWDGGTSNRPGARHGPRALRDASTMLRETNGATGQVPTRAANCADLGDVNMNPVDQPAALQALTDAVMRAVGQGIRPLCVGGDHLCTYGVLRGLGAASESPPALVLLDSHTDLNPPYLGDAFLSHGNPFRRAVEEGLIDPGRSTMIGIRGTAYDRADIAFAAEAGIEVISCDALFDGGFDVAATRAVARAGSGPSYLSFDIDFVDPAFAPGTGTPEVGGPTSREALAILRRLRGLNLIGADLVEVSPPFDQGQTTAWLGATILFEILCLMTDRH